MLEPLPLPGRFTSGSEKEVDLVLSEDLEDLSGEEVWGCAPDPGTVFLYRTF